MNKASLSVKLSLKNAIILACVTAILAQLAQVLAVTDLSTITDYKAWLISTSSGLVLAGVRAALPKLLAASAE